MKGIKMLRNVKAANICVVAEQEALRDLATDVIKGALIDDMIDHDDRGFRWSTVEPPVMKAVRQAMPDASATFMPVGRFQFFVRVKKADVDFTVHIELPGAGSDRQEVDHVAQ
jgi:hypothetical protein